MMLLLFQDLANAFVAVLANEKTYHQVYNISGERYVTFDGIAKAVAKVTIYNLFHASYVLKCLHMLPIVLWGGEPYPCWCLCCVLTMNSCGLGPPLVDSYPLHYLPFPTVTSPTFSVFHGSLLCRCVKTMILKYSLSLRRIPKQFTFCSRKWTCRIHNFEP